MYKVQYLDLWKKSEKNEQNMVHKKESKNCSDEQVV